MIAALFLAIVQPATIDYEAAAKPLSAVLRDISELAGVEMRAGQSVEGDRLVIRVKDAALPKLQEEIAGAVAGKWIERDGVLIIQRDEKQKQEHFDTAVGRRVAGWRADLAKHPSGPRISDAQIEELVKKFYSAADTHHMAEQILSAMDLRQIAAMKPDDRLVFSTSPTKMQIGLPNLDSILDTAIAEHNRIADVASRIEVPQPAVGTQQELLRKRMLQKWQKPLRVLVTADAQKNAVNMVVLLLDSNNRVFGYAGSSRSFETTMELPKLPSHVTGAEEIELSKTASKFAEHLSHVGMERFGSGLAQIDEESLVRFRSPVRYDPLSFQLSEGLIGLAEKTGWQLVASVRDEMVPITPGYIFTVQSVLTDMVGSPAVRYRFADGWLTLGPTDIHGADQIDRPALEKLIRIGESGSETIEDMAEYAQVSPSPWENYVTLPYFSLFVANQNDGVRGRRTLQFFGSLTVAQQRLARSGGEIRVADLLPISKGRLETLAFRTAHPYYTRGEKSLVSASSYEDLSLEPTEVMPFGLPPNGVIRFTPSTMPAVLPVPKGEGNVAMRPVNLTWLAIYEAAEPDSFGGGPPEITEFRIGTEFEVEIEFEGAPGFILHCELKEFRFDKSSKVYNLQNAPSDFRIALEKEIERRRRR